MLLIFEILFVVVNSGKILRGNLKCYFLGMEVETSNLKIFLR